MLGGESKKRLGLVTMIGMDIELEYLIKALKQVWISLQNTEAMGAGNSGRT